MYTDHAFSPSEIIYLFLDGEADPAQRSLLFTALAHDSDLQTEFQEAVALTIGMSYDERHLLPPRELNEKFLGKAYDELSAVASSVAAYAPVSPAHWLRNIMLQTLCAFLLSCIAGVLAFPLLKRAPTAEQEGISVQSLSSHHPVPGVYSPHQHNIPKVEQMRQLSSVSGIPQHSVHTLVPVQAEKHNRNERITDALFREEPIMEKTESVAINSASFRKSIFASPIERDIPPGAISISSLPPMSTWADGFSGRFSLSLRTVMPLAFFPKQAFRASEDLSLNNIIAGVLYHPDNYHTVGIEAGREDFPLYVVNNSGAFDRQSAFLWVGGLYRYTTDPVEFLGGIQPMGQVVLGGTSTGPILKPMAGLAWMPDRAVDFSIAAEGTFLLYRYQSVWRPAEKVSVSFGLTMHL